MNELFRLECRTSYSTTFSSIWIVPSWWDNTVGYKRLFVFNDDGFDIYRKDQTLELHVPYGNIVQEKTIGLGTRAINIYCKGVGKTPDAEFPLSIIRLKTEDRDKILEIIRSHSQQPTQTT